MNNEIKSFLVQIKGNDEWKKIYNYITNLQEENKRLRDNAIHNDKVVDKAKWNEMVYKSRIDIAIDYIEIWQSFPHTNCTTHNELKFLKEILKGE